MMMDTEQVVTATAMVFIFSRVRRFRYTQVVTATEFPGTLQKGWWEEKSQSTGDDSY